MPNILWGKKRVCLGCSARYYDMKRIPPMCPKCGVIIDITLANKSKKSLIINDEIDFTEFDGALDGAEDNVAEVLLDGVDSFDDDIAEIGTFADDEEM